MKTKSILHSIILVLLVSACSSEKADLILHNAEIYTMAESQPWASGVVIKDNIIVKVLDNNHDFSKWKGDDTRIVDLKGAFIVPGFIDGHVHFNRSGSLINDANLMKVSDDVGLVEEIKRVVGIVGEGEWITGGLWGAYEEWELGARDASEKKMEAWKPNRFVIDPFTTDNPCLLNNYNYTMFLANTPALKEAGLLDNPIPGMVLEAGIPNGLIYRDSEAIDIIRDSIAPKSKQRFLNENRAALKVLRESGIVEVHDIATPVQSERFYALQEMGELTCRVWLRPDLSRADELKSSGARMGMHPFTRKDDSFLRYGALKGYIDGIMGTHGALFFEPYDDQPDNFGHYRTHTSDDADLLVPNMEKMYGFIKTGYDAGFVTNVHAIGTKGVSLMLDTYERLMVDVGHTLDGFRVIHAQVIKDDDFSKV